MAIWGKLSGPVHLDLGADITSKAQIRSKVWDFLEKNDIANFPRPVHNRIPNFKGSGTAGLSVAQLPEFQRAQIIKVNPDKAQEEVRYQALDHRKTLLVPTPRLTHGLFNKLVHPGEANKELLRKLSSRQGLAENSVPVSLETRLKIDLVVLGSVAVDRLGHRIGKGEGFADLEFAVAASHHEAVDQDTVVVSTVHDCQVFDSLPEEIFAPHDVPVDIIVTPTQVIRVSNKLTKPQNIIWSMITREKFRQIGLLKEIRFKEKNLGIDVGLKEEVDKKKNSLDKPSKIGGYVGSNVSNKCDDDGKAFAIVGDDKMEKVVGKNVRTKSKPRGIKLDPGIAKIKVEENTTGKIKDDDGQRGNKVNKNESRTEKSEKFDQSDRSKSYRYDRSKMFGVFIGQMAKATRVRDLKKALLAKQVSPTELVWKGHKGIAFVYFEKGGAEILTKLAGLTVKEKVVNIEQVRVMEKESKPMKVKNNNVVNEIKEVSEAEKSNEDKTIKKVDDVNQKRNSETGKVERYSSKRGKRKANGKSQVVVEGGVHEEQSVKDDNIEIESNEVTKTMEVSQNVPKTDELDKIEDIKSESEQKSDNEIVLDANECENLLKIDEVEKNDIENEIILEDSSEIVSVPKIETIDPIDTSSEHFIEPAAMFTSNEKKLMGAADATKEIGDLPAEMLSEVHQRLPPPDLKNAVLVSHLWREVGEEPANWEWCKVTVYSREDITNLAIRRLQHIQEISINPRNWDTGDWEAFFLAAMELSCLKKIDGHRWGGYIAVDAAVDADLFAKSLARLEEVDVSGCTSTQIETLFTEMSRDTRVKKIRLTNHDLSQMDPELFAEVLSKLEDVSLLHNKTTRDQIQALFTKILDQSCLKRLELFEESVSHLERGLFARALAEVEDVALHNYKAIPMSMSMRMSIVTDDQIEELFNALEFGSRVKKLSLSGDVSEVEPEQFSKVLSRMEVVRLDSYRITGDQIRALFNEISFTTQTMKNLDLNDTNLSRLDPGLFSTVLARMEDVRFKHSNRRTTDQLVAFFTEAARSTQLKTLSIYDVDLSRLDPEVLSQAVTRLEAVKLRRSHLTHDQWMSLFTQMSMNTEIKKLVISDSNVSSVDPEVMATVLNLLDEVKLTYAHITRDQALAFFSAMSRNTKLKKVCLEGTDLSTLDPGVLGTALIKLEEINFWETHLSTGQVTTILTHVLEADNKLRKLDLDTDIDAAGVNPEIVRKVQDKLKGKLAI